MKRWVRRSSRCLRSIKVKVTNLPQMTCRACLRLAAVVCESDRLRVSCIIITICILCCVLIVWVSLRDPCFQWQIRKQLCDEYRRGLVAGSLCYALCIERSVSLSHCIEDSRIKIFRLQDLVLKVEYSPPPESLEQTTIKPTPATLFEGITRAELVSAFQGFFSERLGIRDHSKLVDRVLSFADFNQDGELHFGEIRSMWQLLQIREFQILFIFHGNSIFPALNATCGKLYSYEQIQEPILYDKSRTSFWDTLFKNRYRWTLPDWPKRVHIALGLLEYVSLSLEESGSKFYMCDFSPENFGYSEYYEAKVSNVNGIVSEAHLNQSLQQTICRSNTDCVYGKLCRSSCNRQTMRCTGDVRKPDLVHICEVLVDYVLFDTPASLKWTFTRLISRCKDITNPDNDKATRVIGQNLVLSDLADFFWEQLKNEPNRWLYPVTKPVPIFIGN